MKALQKLHDRVANVFGRTSLEFAEAQAVLRAVGKKISVSRAIVFLSDMLTHGTLWREIYSDCGSTRR